MAAEKFVTAINCIDGRAHRPVRDWLKASFDADFVDRITEPGADKVLASGSEDLIEGIKRKVEISVNAHDSETIAVVGHYDCAAHPVSEAEHRRDIEAAVSAVRSWGLPARVVGLWVNADWQVEVVSPLERE